MLNFSIYNVTNTHYNNYDHNYISTMHCHLTSTLSTSDFLCPSARKHCVSARRFLPLLAAATRVVSTVPDAITNGDGIYI